MAESGSDGGGGPVLILDAKDIIEALIKDVNELVDEANGLVGNNSMSSSYRCSTCTKLSHDHPNGDVKGCKRKHLTADEYIKDLKLQRDGLTAHVSLLRKGAQAIVDRDECEDLLREQKGVINNLRDEQPSPIKSNWH